MPSKIWRLLVAMRLAAKSPAYSASATNEQTTGIRVEWVEIGWLRGASSEWSPRKRELPATLPARGRERYEVSERERRTISEARNIFRPLGWVAAYPRRRSRRVMVSEIGEACSEAKAQVAGKKRGSTARP